MRADPEIDKTVNTKFRGKWRNAANLGVSEAETVALWNTAHPEDPIEM